MGSVKGAVADAMAAAAPAGVHVIPGHPVAGTELSGPDAGFASLFENRWTILTPPPGVDQDALETLTEFWMRLGSRVELMDARHHDLVLAVTSHLPHLIAYNIVGSTADLEEVTQGEVMKYSAGGFRDYARIAASDPIMWRDVFLTNKDAVLEILGRFTEDLQALSRSLRWSEGDKLEAAPALAPSASSIVAAGQESAEPKLRARPSGADFPPLAQDLPERHAPSCLWGRRFIATLGVSLFSPARAAPARAARIGAATRLM